METSNGPSYATIKKRMAESPAYKDVCLCMVGDYSGPWYRRLKDKKCCTHCSGCGSRIKRDAKGGTAILEAHKKKCRAYLELPF